MKSVSLGQMHYSVAAGTKVLLCIKYQAIYGKSVHLLFKLSKNKPSG